ncbi:class-II fumarase/aspartase family protein [Amycolatopsis anabasis]|uniref:class-II fumarase/aspartase family protein n=1 Tax=Amycolatopsis anabasis TaxID=1840409 RepID=UPI001FE8B88D|nr:adenylosuccinate lyase family protein [Amycolatopsis anabasis]
MTPGTDSGLLAPVWAGTGLGALVSDEAWLRAMVDVEAALARAQARLGVVPGSAAAVIESVARGDGVDLLEVAERARGAANPVVVLVERFTAAVAARDPAAAEYVHRGGTSQDILDSAAMVLSGRVLAVVEADLRRTGWALARLAAEHRNTPMAGRTLTQHAVPITFGLKAAGWLQLVLDAFERVSRVVLPAQLGGAAGTCASYVAYARLATGSPAGGGVELVRVFAEEAGLAEPVVPWHALRTPIADLGAACAFVAGALGKFGVDVQMMSRTEVGEVTEPAGEGRGVSSAMPQKRNPVLATLLVSAARQVPAYGSILVQSLVAEDERSAGGWHAEWQPLRESLRLTAGAARTAAELAEGLIAHPGRLRENLGLTGGSIVSERLNAELAEALGKANAKKLLARVARRAADEGRPFAETLAATPELANGLADRVPELLDPERYLGASADLTARVLTRAASLLA